MTQDRFLELIEKPLREAGSIDAGGEEFRQPPLSVLHYYRRNVRWSKVPLLGGALSVTCTIRQPPDLDGTRAGYERLLTRVAMAVNGRFPPWQALAIGLVAIVLAPEPIGPADDAMLGEVLQLKLRRMRVVPLGVFRVNLVQEAMALAVKASPAGLFNEAVQLSDALTEHFRRYVPPIRA